MDYQQQALDFCKKNGVRINVTYLKYDYHFAGDKERRNIYKVIIVRKGKRMTVNFGQSIAGTEQGLIPDKYSVLACLTKSDPEDFNYFCADYGYDNDSTKAHKIYKAIVKEWKDVERIFEDCIEELREIA